MKKLVLALLSFFLMQSVVMASNDKPIQVSELPQAARTFINKNFAGVKVSFAMVEEEFLSKEYKVVFADGSKVEFDKKGEWTGVDCKHAVVPTDVVPKEIQEFISKHHSDQKVLKIEHDRLGYEVKLSAGIELKFDSKLSFVRYDD